MSTRPTDSQEVVDRTRQLDYATWRSQKGWSPLHIVDADGCYFTDSHGRRYLDFSAQLICVNLGHKNPAVIQAIRDQAGTLPYIAPSYATDVRAELSQLLLEVLPQGLEKFFFTTSGTDAVEAAIKIARLYTGKRKIVSRYRSYHGSTMASIAATGDHRRWFAETDAKGHGVVFAPEVNCYNCPIKHHYPECDVACADYLDHIVENEGDVAAVLIEPIVGTNGVLIPPLEYLPRLRRICDQRNILLIVDEVMTGWGRTGKWFAVDHWAVRPDILVTAKGITSAYVPLGLCATSRSIATYFEEHVFAHGHTYEAHPLMLATAIATINEMRRLNLVERAHDMGRYLGQKLRDVMSRHTSVGDVRGIGLLWAVDLVKNRTSKEPLNSKAEKASGTRLVVEEIATEMMKKGVSVQAWLSHLILAPPLIITEAEIDVAIEVLDDALSVADKHTQDSTDGPID